MAFSALIALALVAAAAAVPVTPITSLPGFETLKLCTDQSCITNNNNVQGWKTLLQKGYEPLGLPKMEPIHYDLVEFDNKELNFHIKSNNVDVFHFTDFINPKYVVDKNTKVIKQEMTFVNLVVKGHFESTYKLAKEHKFQSDVEITYPKITMTVNRQYALEKHPYGDKTEDFIMIKGHTVTHKMEETPVFKFSDEYIKATSEDKELQEFLTQHGGDSARNQMRLKLSEQFFEMVSETYASFTKKFDETIPVRTYLPNYNEIY